MHPPRYLVLGLMIVQGCGGSITVPGDAGTPGDGGGDAQQEIDSGTQQEIDSGTRDGGLVPPRDLAPCETGTCWETDATPARCNLITVTEDFSSGRYNIHAYTTRVHAGVETVVRLGRLEGTFEPALIILDGAGRTVSDGERGLVEPGLNVTVELDGRGEDQARARIASDVDSALTLHVTGWAIVDEGFAPALGTDVIYEMDVDSECAEEAPCTVVGHRVAEPACGWLHYVAQVVVPQLDGPREQRLEDAARVAWWSLKEGVLSLENPIVYSNCNFPDGDAHIGPLDTCPSRRAWQVGLSAIQVPNFEESEIEDTAARLFPDITLGTLLERTAIEALLDADEARAVVESTGDLRTSWLLRASAVGFTLQVGPVTAQCIDGSLSWCYGSRWDTTRLYAPDKATALAAIDDIRTLLDTLAP